MEELLRMHVGELDSDYGEADNTRARQTLKVGQQISISARHRRKDGTTYPVRGVVTPVKRRDGTIAISSKP